MGKCQDKEVSCRRKRKKKGAKKQMSERERLIKLLFKVVEEIDCPQPDEVADYLLKKGVVVLPCPLGSTVYIISKYSCKECVKSIGGCDYLGQCPEKVYEREFSFSMRNSVGKSVWLTREEAEKVLQERRAISDA
jgi:hypothetical protein